jgi:pimeloyl-ACP methyl ester carboxylesterase
VNIIKTQNFEIAVNLEGDEKAKKLAILMPGRLDTKDYANFVSHSEFLAKKGYRVASIDPPGTWDSPGKLSGYSTSTYLQAVNELIEYFESIPTLLLGHSRGGATAMLASPNPSVEAVVLINAAYGKPTPPDPTKIENGCLKEFRDIPPGNVRTDSQKRFDLPMNYFEDGQKHDPVGALAAFERPKLLVHAENDEFLELDAVRDIYKRLPEPKVLHTISCAHDYRLDPKSIESVEKALGQFIDEHLSL